MTSGVKYTIVLEFENIKMEFVGHSANELFNLYSLILRNLNLRSSTSFYNRAQKVWVDDKLVKSKFDTPKYKLLRGDKWTAVPRDDDDTLDT